MTDEELNRAAHFAATTRDVAADLFARAEVAAGSLAALVAEVRRLRLELEGERKANALLNAGMGSLAESRDELKHKCRQLEARVAERGESEMDDRTEPVKPIVPVKRGRFKSVLDMVVTLNAEHVQELQAEIDRLQARVAELEAALEPFVAASERCRMIADAIAGDGRPCSVQPVHVEHLIRAAAALKGGV